MQTLSPWRVEVFYDGDCPLCRREIDMMKRFDRRKRIRFTDIASGEFRPEDYGKSMDQLMAEIHGRLPDGRWVIGVEVFRQLYAALGLGPVVAVTRMPGLSHGLDFAYRFFAKRRLQWTGRCSAQGGHCRVPE